MLDVLGMGQPISTSSPSRGRLGISVNSKPWRKESTRNSLDTLGLSVLSVNEGKILLIFSPSALTFRTSISRVLGVGRCSPSSDVLES